MKTQRIRLLDVFVLGPLMIRSGWITRKQSPLTSVAMLIGGTATIVYNWQNYRDVERAGK